ncbi:hypothetical protein [Sphingomonas sp.]|uniref:hypothetical protein n=1 Tax=Sphingomonas sp. TaxID=28214 RepID=UPI001B04F021|nr:hypothetical protein [Sphingomonas sp.]MBO9713190.1 hypothetical protein [Sphingomonas sp.]
MEPQQPHGLDDPDYAAFAWGRFRRILGWMAAAAVVASVAADGVLWWMMGWFSPFTMIVTFLGTFLTIMSAALLMGLMFLSSGSGHDEQVEDRLKGEIDLD